MTVAVATKLTRRASDVCGQNNYISWCFCQNILIKISFYNEFSFLKSKIQTIMASQGEKTTGKDEGEVKSTPSNQDVAPPLVSMKGGKLYFIAFVLFYSPFLITFL